MHREEPFQFALIEIMSIASQLVNDSQKVVISIDNLLLILSD